MDTFFEQIVAIRKNWKTITLFILVWLLAFVICAFFFLTNLLGGFILFLVFGVFYGAYKITSILNVEYEYIITNGTLDIDKILNKSSRKRILSLDLSKVSRIEKFNPALVSKINSKQLVMACNDNDDAYLLVVESEGKGATYLVFAPEERLRGAVIKFVPKFIAISAFK